jgi:hypothetical protein
VNPVGLNAAHVPRLVQGLCLRSRYLQVLKLTHINLQSEVCIGAVEQFIELGDFIDLLDVSHCNLKAGHLLRIAERLKRQPDNIKQLNIGYNRLVGGKDFLEYLEDDLDVAWTKSRKNESTEFLLVFTDYLQKTHMLNHLDISGLQLMEVVYALMRKPQRKLKNAKTTKKPKKKKQEAKKAPNRKFKNILKFIELHTQSREAQINDLQNSLIWNRFTELLTAIADAPCLLAVHMSDNGFLQNLETALMEVPNQVSMSIEDLPEYQLFSDIMQVFHLNDRSVWTDSDGAKKGRRRVAAKMISDQVRGATIDYTQLIRKACAMHATGDMDQAKLRGIFDVQATPEPIRELEKFLDGNGSDFKAFCGRRPKLQRALYDLQLEN